MSSPLKMIVPSLRSISRFTSSRVVVFPHPDGPTNTVVVPRSTSKEISSMATVPSPYTFATLLNLTIESVILLPPRLRW